MILDKAKNGIEKRFYDLCLEVIPAQDLSLYDMNYVAGNTKLSVFIINDKTGTADLEECVKVDRALSPFLEEDWVPNDLTLEVSSPGVYRNLTSVKHFESAVGEDVQVVLTKKLDATDLPKKMNGQKKIIAKLEAFNGEGLELRYDDYKFSVLIEDLKKVTLHPDVTG